MQWLQGTACPHTPQWLVCSSGATGMLLQLLTACSDAPTVAACLATLNNMFTLEDGQERICEEARRSGPQVHIVSHLNVWIILGMHSPSWLSTRNNLWRA